MIGESVGPYRLVSELGAGGMGTVYLAEVEGRAPGIDTGTQVALKIVHHHLLEQPGFFKRFMREADIGKEVDDDNVVRTLDVDAILSGGKSYHYLVMEYVEGQTLRELVREFGRIPEELCRHIGREVARALAAIHRVGVVHRDLKPDNVLITGDEQIKVMDLGVARLADEAIRLSQTGAFVGSVLYAAPEQFTGASGTDGRADLYALGLTMYELAAGQHPFADEDLRVAMRRQLHEDPRPISDLNPQLTPFLEELVKTLLAKSADERFATADEVVSVLDEGEDSEWWKKRAQEIRIETKQPLRRVRVPRESDLYGRDDELVKLNSLFERVKSGEGQVLFLDGEAGIGKTRLVDEFVGRLRQSGEDLNFLFGAYPPGGAATAAGAFSTAYREHFGSEGLEKALGEYLTQTPLLIPAFAALLRGDATPTGCEPLNRDSIQTVFVHATRALAAERPTVILIDDLHYAPEGGRAIFAALALALAEHRVLMIGTGRRGLPDDWLAGIDRQEHVSRMRLHRLGPKDVGKLLVDVFRSQRLADELGFQVLTKSDGNPFFVFEIVRGLREGEFITRSEDGSWAKTGMIRDIQIPSSVMDLIDARISDLDEEEKDLLEVSACAGYEFDPSLVAEALGQGVLPALKRFARIEKKHRLIVSAGRRYQFDHGQVQESLYAGIFEQIREHYHAALGDALEKREGTATKEPGDVDGALAVELCNHFLAARRGEQATRYLERALTHLAAGYLHDEAVRLADRALSVDGLLAGEERLGVLLKKASRLATLGRRDEQRAVLREALAVADAGEDPLARARVLHSLGTERSETGRNEESLAVYGEAIDIAREAGDTDLESRLVSALGLAYWRLGRFEESQAALERRMSLSRETGNAKAEGAAAGSLALAKWDLGHVAEARDLLELARSRGITDYNTLNLGELYGLLGDPERAHALIEEGRRHAREIGNRRAEACTLHELGDLAEREGDLSTAASLYDAALSLDRDIEFQYDAAETLVLYGRLCLARGDASEARRRLEAGLALSREIRRRDSEALAAAYLALLEGGDAAEAESLCATNEEHTGPLEAVEIQYVLWRATGKPEHLAEAHKWLVYLREHAPEEYRDTMIENVPLHRDVWAAAEEAGL